MQNNNTLTVTRMEKPAFCVIGKAGSTDDGDGFIARLWDDANAHFPEIAHLALTDDNGVPCGVWGCMTDFTEQFLLWEDNFSRGLYLAGAECAPAAEAPDGWSKWTLPGFVFLITENNTPDIFSRMISYLSENHIPLIGAVQEYSRPASGISYLCFPVERL